MKLEIVLPTKNRTEKLDDCLSSIFVSAKDRIINVYVYFSIIEEYEHYQSLFKDIPEVHIEFFENYRVPDFWNSHLKKTVADAICYVNDDVLFLPNTIDNIERTFDKVFPDYDGIMGLRQENIPKDQALESAFGIIGRKYADRFPDKQVFCPEYNRFFADKEIWLYANKVSKFHFNDNIRIIHLHPAFGGTEDSTHKDVRRYLAKDKDTFRRRQALNYLWGNDFNLINKG